MPEYRDHGFIRNLGLKQTGPRAAFWVPCALLTSQACVPLKPMCGHHLWGSGILRFLPLSVAAVSAPDGSSWELVLRTQPTSRDNCWGWDWSPLQEPAGLHSIAGLTQAGGILKAAVPPVLPSVPPSCLATFPLLSSFPAAWPSVTLPLKSDTVWPSKVTFGKQECEKDLVLVLIPLFFPAEMPEGSQYPRPGSGSVVSPRGARPLIAFLSFSLVPGVGRLRVTRLWGHPAGALMSSLCSAAHRCLPGSSGQQCYACWPAMETAGNSPGHPASHPPLQLHLCLL